MASSSSACLLVHRKFPKLTDLALTRPRPDRRSTNNNCRVRQGSQCPAEAPVGGLVSARLLPSSSLSLSLSSPRLWRSPGGGTVLAIKSSGRKHKKWNRSPRDENLSYGLQRHGGKGEARTCGGVSAVHSLGKRGRQQGIREYSTMEESEDTGEVTCKHVVSVVIPMASDIIWKLWMDLERAPNWMQWIDRVELVQDGSLTPTKEDALHNSDTGNRMALSRWFCSTSGFEVSWLAHIESIEMNPPRRFVQWNAVEGLPSSGKVSFQDSNGGKATTVKLSISHALPNALRAVIPVDAFASLVQATLKKDLERFQDYAFGVLKERGQEILI
ncbi:hypothetical protein CBR_g10981 [Chara braunii]|uniref:Coenzyme Q-binding protein COQ10 START domain-containing protein n=1 Tax=Chara braunii TaxID=69332 RepID=A0A388KPS1_CHABU|nr:hypothetical protein CBR_g10981 [Chara braunii]|eukprot:GBG72046.1 hypothetical protein CBR_g10981 [Chara braunii]